jgi:hypothetical protein
MNENTVFAETCECEEDATEEVSADGVNVSGGGESVSAPRSLFVDVGRMTFNGCVRRSCENLRSGLRGHEDPQRTTCDLFGVSSPGCEMPPNAETCWEGRDARGKLNDRSEESFEVTDSDPRNGPRFTGGLVILVTQDWQSTPSEGVGGIALKKDFRRLEVLLQALHTNGREQVMQAVVFSLRHNKLLSFRSAEALTFSVEMSGNTRSRRLSGSACTTCCSSRMPLSLKEPK